MRGPRRREFSKAIRKLKFHGSTVLEEAGEVERQTHTEAVTHTLIGWCLGKLEIMLTRFHYGLSPGSSS